MKEGPERHFVEELLRRNRYLVLGTTDGGMPWTAPPEYMVDDELNFYFKALSPPMPPYSVFKIEPRRFYLPKIDGGVNVRVEVE